MNQNLTETQVLKTTIETLQLFVKHLSSSVKYLQDGVICEDPDTIIWRTEQLIVAAQMASESVQSVAMMAKIAKNADTLNK